MATFAVKSIVPLRQEKEKEERELWGRSGSKGQFLDPAATAEPSLLRAPNCGWATKSACGLVRERPSPSLILGANTSVMIAS